MDQPIVTEGKTGESAHDRRRQMLLLTYTGVCIGPITKRELRLRIILEFPGLLLVDYFGYDGHAYHPKCHHRFAADRYQRTIQYLLQSRTTDSNRFVHLFRNVSQPNDGNVERCKK